MEFDALLPVFAAALVLIGMAVAAMAVGVMFRRPCLRGSCGGVRGAGEGERCHDCPNRGTHPAG